MAFLCFAAISFGLGSSWLLKALPIKGIVVAGAIVLVLGTLLFSVKRWRLSVLKRLAPLWFFVLFGASLNVVGSETPLSSAVHWMSWAVMVGVTYDLARTSTPVTFESILRWTPPLLVLMGILIWTQGHGNPDIEEKRFHLAATYFGLCPAIAVYLPRLRSRVVWSVLGVVGVYLTGSRGPLLILGVVALAYCIYLVRSRRARDAVLVVLIGIGLFIAQAMIPGLWERFFEKKLAIYSSGLESLRATWDTRMYLIQEGLRLADDRLFGYGAGETYSIWFKGYELSAHNGYLDTVIQLGFPITIALTLLYLWLIVRLIRAPHVNLRQKAGLVTFIAVLSVRGMGESHWIFASASFHFLLLWYFLWYGSLRRSGFRGRRSGGTHEIERRARARSARVSELRGEEGT